MCSLSTLCHYLTFFTKQTHRRSTRSSFSRSRGESLLCPSLTWLTYKPSSCLWNFTLIHMSYWTRAFSTRPWALCIWRWGRASTSLIWHQLSSASCVLHKNYLMKGYNGNLTFSHKVFLWKIVHLVLGGSLSRMRSLRIVIWTEEGISYIFLNLSSSWKDKP